MILRGGFFFTAVLWTGVRVKLQHISHFSLSNIVGDAVITDLSSDVEIRPPSISAQRLQHITVNNCFAQWTNLLSRKCTFCHTWTWTLQQQHVYDQKMWILQFHLHAFCFSVVNWCALRLSWMWASWISSIQLVWSYWLQIVFLWTSWISQACISPALHTEPRSGNSSWNNPLGF